MQRRLGTDSLPHRLLSRVSRWHDSGSKDALERRNRRAHRAPPSDEAGNASGKSAGRTSGRPPSASTNCRSSQSVGLNPKSGRVNPKAGRVSLKSGRGQFPPPISSGQDPFSPESGTIELRSERLHLSHLLPVAADILAHAARASGRVSSFLLSSPVSTRPPLPREPGPRDSCIRMPPRCSPQLEGATTMRRVTRFAGLAFGSPR